MRSWSSLKPDPIENGRDAQLTVLARLARLGNTVLKHRLRFIDAVLELLMKPIQIFLQPSGAPRLYSREPHRGQP